MQYWIIHFMWVKAQIGIEGNEAADKLDKAAAQDKENQNTVFRRIPLTSIASEINRKGLEQWQRQWNNLEKGVVGRSFLSRDWSTG
jgi:hypothetical protein